MSSTKVTNKIYVSNSYCKHSLINKNSTRNILQNTVILL